MRLNRKILKTSLNKDFEKWAIQHKFICEWDSTIGIYTSTFTQGAWMAYEQRDKEIKDAN